MSKTIKLTDEVWDRLAGIAKVDGNTIAGEINILVAEHNIAKQICDRIDKMETAIRDIRVPAGEPQQLQPVVLTPFPEQMTRQEASYDTQSPTPSMSDRTVDEIFEDIKQIQAKLKTLDKGDPKRKGLEDRLRADNAELALLGDD